MFKGKKCKRCEGKLKEVYSFCPYCGMDLRNPEKDMEDFGMLGKGNNIEGFPLIGGGGLGVSDKIVDKILNSFMRNIPDLMKNLEKQMDDVEPEIQSLPNGIRIKVRGPFKKSGSEKEKKKDVQKVITSEQIKRMSSLPRVEAKSNVKRLSDKVVYELKAPGVEDVQDVFVSKLENGYEVKAIGRKKVYVSNIPINLPLRGYKVSDVGLTVEFSLG